LNTLKCYFDPAACIYNSFFEILLEFTRFRVIPLVFNEAGAVATRTFDERILPSPHPLIFSRLYSILSRGARLRCRIAAALRSLASFYPPNLARERESGVSNRATGDRPECIDGPRDRD